MQHPLELCSWKDREALPPIGKEYQQGYKRVNDRRPKAVVSDVPDCQGVAYAQQQGIPVLTYPIPKKGGFPGLTAAQLVDGLKNTYKADFVLLAGYLKVTQWCSQACACDTSVSAVFSPLSWGISTGIMNGVNSLLGMNPAPSPAADSTRAAPGLPQGLIAGLLAGNGVERAAGAEGAPMLGAGLVTAGAHVVAALVLQQEHKVYPEAVAALVDGRISWREDGIPIMWTSQ
ncbi:formyl_trans_N domain-containing protein [Haematococcus lacustris]|uniref:phosphoribosylglycinamide formyltransferase 1 n=1 Tax=Haematococcus lacustris TaxID=44745 RepID=A0A699ZDC8_HAELA|nr:formyl_trans_N domain-containing protein [Haematococcus lacustris]